MILNAVRGAVSDGTELWILASRESRRARDGAKSLVALSNEFQILTFKIVPWCGEL
jgi:hypothetical protein